MQLEPTLRKERTDKDICEDARSGHFGPFPCSGTLQINASTPFQCNRVFLDNTRLLEKNHALKSLERIFVRVCRATLSEQAGVPTTLRSMPDH